MNSNKKYDFYKNSIYYLIANAVIVLAAIIVISICGFNYSTSIAGGKILLQSTLSVIISLLIVFLYVGLRYDFAKAFSIVLTATHNALLSTALIAIIRVPVTESIIMGLILLVGLSSVYTLILTDKLKDINLKKVDYNEIIKNSISSSIKQLVILSAVIVVLLLLSLITLSASMFNLIRILLVMVFVLIYSSLTIILPSWCYFSSKIKKVKKAKVDANVENQKVVKAATIYGEEVGSATISKNETEE
jgi:preprotein translocase subunit SecF